MQVRLKRRLVYGGIPFVLGLLVSIPFGNPLAACIGLAIGWILANNGEQARRYLAEEKLLPRFLVQDITPHVQKVPRVQEEPHQAELTEPEPVIALPAAHQSSAERTDFTVPVDVEPPALPEQVELPQDEAPAPPAKLEPTWESLIAAHYLRPDAPYILAVREDGSPMEMRELTSVGIGGAPGSGKTVTVTSLVAQTIAKYNGKVRMLVVDPHMESQSDDALAARLLPGIAPFLFDAPQVGENPVSGGEDLARWMWYLESGIRGRIAGKDSFGGDFLLLIIDEFASLMDDPQMAGPLMTLLDLINSQARKVRAFALVSSPHWKGDRIPTDLRSTLPTFLVHQMPPSIAQQIVPAQIAQQANRLGTGQIIAFHRGMAGTGRVPMTEQGMLAAIARRFAPGSFDGIQPVSSASPVGPEPAFKDVIAASRGYQALVTLNYSEAEAIRWVAMDIYKSSSAESQEMVRRALQLAEEHSVA